MSPKRPPEPSAMNEDRTVETNEDEIPTGNFDPVGSTLTQAPAEDDNPGATAFVRVDQPAAGPAADENPGATAFVRVDAPAGKSGKAAPPLPARRAAPQPSAPKKGLQVTLPDDEPAAPPPPKKIVPKVPDKKGRRGAWWDEKTEPEPEPDPDDLPGGTALVKVERPPPEPEPEPEPPPPPPPPKEIEVEPYRPVPADDYAGHLKPGEPPWKVWTRRAIWTGVALAILAVGGLIAGYVYLSREIPTFDSIRDYHPFMASKVVAEGGTVVGQFYRERRTVVPMDQIPRVLTQAVVSAEDKDFYKHPGFNILALARAVVVDALSGRKRLGASTITQQVVKNFFLTSEKKWKRKLKEILLSARLEHNLSKDDILYLYLNQINFGRAHYGVEEASLYYFNKHVQDIDLGEAAILAGLPQNPSRINPRRHPERAKKRQIYVLDRMLANHYISQDDHDREVDKPIVLPPPPQEPPGAWYLDEVRRQMIAQFGDAPTDTAGMTVEVAMDPHLQWAAEVALQESLRAVDKRQGWRGPEVKLDTDRLDAYRTALGRKLASVAQTQDQPWVLDLEGIHSAAVRKIAPKKPVKKKAADEEADPEAGDEADVPADSVAPDAVARAARARPLVPNEIYAGIVTFVGRNDATVELAPGIAGSVPFSSMSWARPFKPEHSTPAPRSPSEVVAIGDVVPVRVTHIQTVRTSSGTRVLRLELGLEQTPKVEGAFVGMDLKTRGVLALVGGYDMAISSFNRATQAKRQPGSSFKPFLYAAALDAGKYTPVTKMDDSPEVITDPWTGKAWKPQNFEKDEFDGQITLRKALAESKNTVAVKLLIDVGIDKVRSEARAAGILSEIPQSYTAALGTGEVGILEEINAYATLASQGKRTDPVLIKRVLSRDGNTVFAAADHMEQPVKPETAYLVSDLMRSVIDDPAGTAHSLSALDRPAAGKTGTASEHRDAWFVGFTPSFLAGGWVGFDTHEMMGAYETGGHAAGPMWLTWMRAATANTPREEWPDPPPGVTVVQINRNTGQLAKEGDPYAVREVFM
ncbi:MAG: PBP1A family penicillin-binding protein, partial [Myxococcales bacterium]|nr:PBP1A family penicillin-binding protein [Myxococcales bacterium]